MRLSEFWGRVSVKELHIAVGVLAIILNAAAALLGAWSWHQVRTSAWFWRPIAA